MRLNLSDWVELRLYAKDMGLCPNNDMKGISVIKSDRFNKQQSP